MSVRRSLKVLRGNKATMPTLDTGEFGLAVDTKELYIGMATGNTKIPIGDGDALKINSYTVNIPTTGWTKSGSVYTNTITVTGLTDPGNNGMVTMNPVYTAATYQSVMAEYSKIFDANATTNALVLTTLKPIESAISVTLKEVKK